MKVLHVITGLNVGGAEAMLAKLLERWAAASTSDDYQSTVVSLAKPGAISGRVAACATLETLGMSEGVPSAAAGIKLVRLARCVKPNLVVGWMHHGNLAASLAAATMHIRPPVIWNVRHSLSDIREEKPLTRLVLRVGAKVSPTVDAIVYNSHVASRQYRALGYAGERAFVIPNGFDCDRYRPRRDARAKLRARIGVAPTATLVGMVARRHPMKDPGTLVQAVRTARAKGADIHLLLIGQGMDELPSDLTADLPHDRCTALGQCNDLPEVMPGLDVLVLPSAWGEAFPNTLAEAMACGVPCVATDIGDCGLIIGDTGRVVAPRDAEAMAAALLELVGLGTEGRAHLGEAARQRVLDNFALDQIHPRFDELYRTVVRQHGPRRAARGIGSPAVGSGSASS
jgi:glycosyltransferase involved in cell wall biosynthesis